jgi:hypothetical protein
VVCLPWANQRRKPDGSGKRLTFFVNALTQELRQQSSKICAPVVAIYVLSVLSLAGRRTLILERPTKCL